MVVNNILYDVDDMMLTAKKNFHKTEFKSIHKIKTKNEASSKQVRIRSIMILHFSASFWFKKYTYSKF